MYPSLSLTLPLFYTYVHTRCLNLTAAKLAHMHIPILEFLESYIKYLARTVSSGTWDMKVVVDTVVDHCCCVHSDSSSGQMMIGMDTKFILSPLRMLPQSIRHWIVQALLPKQIPAMMEDSYHY